MLTDEELEEIKIWLTERGWFREGAGKTTTRAELYCVRLYKHIDALNKARKEDTKLIEQLSSGLKRHSISITWER
ncbi:MAG: hypothetical protein MJA83_10170 [Gammaproteobacteria bacterium]|nr:hypothetical protein [Gammaproteobacteria bacterium]